MENIRTSVRVLRADGLGHAIPLIDDPELVKHVAANGIRVSGCPASYLQTGLIKDARELGITELLDRGVIYTLNPDDDLFLPPMEKVLAVCDAAYGFTAEQCAKLERNVWLGAFAKR